MRIAVVGTGIAGLVAARRLHREHELDVFEAAAWIGGHTHTLDVPRGDGTSVAVDTGFIVFNRATYPRFCALLAELGIDAQPSDMSFSVSCAASGLEYEASGWNGLLARRTNALRPAFWRMLRDIARFYREAPRTLEGPDDGATLGEFLERGRYSRAFVEQHLFPMVAAVWSARPEVLRDFPLRFLVRFFENHGFLRLAGRPQWLAVPGGSARYVERLVAPFRARIRLETPVVRLARVAGGVQLRTLQGEEHLYERVIVATHSDQALRMLADATPREREVLGAFAYQPNDVVLHTDAHLMPRRRRAWASWNVHRARVPGALPTVTYWMNRLQSLREPRDYLVTLNRTAQIDPARILARFTYHHPVYSRAAVAAQARHAEIDGVHGVHFCGAYWGNGFHEDGVRSAEAVLARFPSEVPA
ncbi:MAG TPA: FAD-dependent oxidoreductase [Planctomycetota bacterium]